MKSTFLLAAAALATGNAAAATDEAFNTTATEPTTRQLATNFYPPATFRLVGADIVALDIGNRKKTNPDECFKFCARIAPEIFLERCTAATWTNQDGGTCYAKDAGWHAPSTIPKAEAESYFLLENAQRTFIWSLTKDGFDMAGNDIDNKRGGSMSNCMDLCNANSKCYAVTWTNYNGGTCWLKSRASGYVAKAGAKVAYVARKFNGPQ